MRNEIDDLEVMNVYKVSFKVDYATIVVDHNLAPDDDSAIEEAKYWMDLSGVSSVNPATDIELEVRE